jgi:dipeptidyl aminopeptidase/acylaminoacyl peptidase
MRSDGGVVRGSPISKAPSRLRHGRPRQHGRVRRLRPAGLSKGSDIYTIRHDGSHLRRITDLGVATDQRGRRTGGSSREVKYGDLWVMTAGNGSFRRLTRHRAAWSTRPHLVARRKAHRFRRRGSSTGDVLVVDANGRHVQRLTTGDGDCRSPAWAPSGNRILFSARYDGNPDLFSIAAIGGDPRPLLQTPGSEVEVGSSSAR